MKDLIEHRPIPKTNVKIEGKEYECKHGSVYLPERYEQFNPVDEPIEEKPIKKTKKK
ncbi:MAG: hypothetical protein GY928_21290 [Colwellia sp.]|nr:hypothetical protein [Colwellia sp.]